MNKHTELRLKAKALQMTSVASFLLLAACSGGGGGSEPASIASVDAQPAPSVPEIVAPEVNPSPESTAPPVITAEPEVLPEVDSTADLEASSDFVFGTSYQLPLNVDLSERVSGEALLVVCEQFAEVGGRYEVDYSDCILRAPLTDGVYQGSLKLTNDTQKLLAAVWTYEEGSEPEFHAWTFANSPQTFTVR